MGLRGEIVSQNNGNRTRDKLTKDEDDETRLCTRRIEQSEKLDVCNLIKG